jgi:hypothetical protein
MTYVLDFHALKVFDEESQGGIKALYIRTSIADYFIQNTNDHNYKRDKVVTSIGSRKRAVRKLL